jgi:hypothetical protein
MPSRRMDTKSAIAPLTRIKHFILSPTAIYTGVGITIVSGLAAFIASLAFSLNLLTPQAYERKMSLIFACLYFGMGFWWCCGLIELINTVREFFQNRRKNKRQQLPPIF